MESVDWGVDSPPLDLGADHAMSVETEDVSALPVVRAARGLGFEPAPEAPLWAFLPAVWPRDDRAWVHDRRVRHMSVSCEGQPSRRVPWAAAEYFGIEAEVNRLLVECGLPARPPGRVWLLRPPPGCDSVRVALHRLLSSAERAGLDVVVTQRFVEQVRRDLAVLFGSGG